MPLHGPHICLGKFHGQWQVNFVLRAEAFTVLLKIFNVFTIATLIPTATMVLNDSDTS